jgi:hypothetical protein
MARISIRVAWPAISLPPPHGGPDDSVASFTVEHCWGRSESHSSALARMNPCISVSVPALYVGSVSRESSFGSVDQVVEECGSFWLVVVAGVVSLADEDGDEFVSGPEVGAGLAG